MAKLGGYAGKILKVNLESGKVSTQPLSTDLAVRFIGGAGLNARLAYDTIPQGTAALSPRSAMVLGAGPLVGTLAPSAGRTNITSKSPLSGFLGTSGAGEMGRLKFCGYDHVIIEGKANVPVFLEIGDDVHIREATHLWGKDTWEATDLIWEDLGRDYTVAAIGPAGENLVGTASILANKNVAYGKTGLGAVMGSKNLKALALKGSKGIGVADPKRFMKLVNDICLKIKDLPGLKYWRNLGNFISFNKWIQAEGKTIPIRNSQGVGDETFTAGLDPKEVGRLMAKSRNVSCLACPVGCKHFLRLTKGRYAGLAMTVGCLGSPAMSFGGQCGLIGWDNIFKCCELCNRLGLDHGTAGLISMAIELYERGIINHQDTDGVDLDWQPDVVNELLHKIAHRTGFGDVLADGSIEGPSHMGRGVEYYSLHFKGVPSITGDPRPALATWIRSLVTSPAGQTLPLDETCGLSPDEGIRFLKNKGIPEEGIRRVLSGPEGYNAAEATRWNEDYVFALECLGLCAFMNQLFDINAWAEIYSAATGIEMDGAGLLGAAARGMDMRKAFNLREGASRKDDTLPRRFMTEAVNVRGKQRPPFGQTDLDALVTEYYEARGWDPKEGRVCVRRLDDLLA